MDDGIRSGKSLSLGMPMAPQGKILRRLKHLSLWMPPEWHPLFIPTTIGILLETIFLFVTCYVSCLERLICFEFLLSLLLDQSHKSLLYTLALREPKWFYFVRMAHMLRLNFL